MFLKMKLFYSYTNLEFRVRRLERAQYWRDKYGKREVKKIKCH
jgi:hypothetical protein